MALTVRGGIKVYAGSPAAARAYLQADRSRADDYYLTEGSGLARRYSAGPDRRVRELAPLAGDGYQTWVAGQDPDTGQPRGWLRTDDRAVRFVEVLVNGPKSWSLAAALHPDVAAAYDAAQDRAAAQIIGWLAAHATTRIGPRGAQVQVPVEVLEAVTVRHYTSRAGDPHRHLHLQVNARVYAAGKWRGLHTVGVRDSLAAINGIGHAAVACDPQFGAALAAHGYTFAVDGEIRQLSEFVGPFSARAVQIERNVERYEREWTAAHPGETPGPALRRAWDARAWADGRPDKVTPKPGTDMTERWRAELAALGYRDPGHPVSPDVTPVGALNRDHLAGQALVRLAVGRSAWNAADIRGQVEQLIADAGVVVDAAVRIELAEDLTTRALARCQPLVDHDGVPEHVRVLTSRQVLDVEADLTARLAARSTATGSGPAMVSTHAAADIRGLDAGQAAVVAALAADHPLVVVEGAAGAGKTTILSATRDLLDEHGRRLVVVTPTLKAAQIAAAEVGAAAGSAAWLVHQHGWRWDDDRPWIRLTPGQADPTTGRPYTGPEDAARLRSGDLLVVDEAGMLDQDTARALLTVADEAGARVALLGDRQQLAAVGRGGVLDLAVRAADPTGVLALDRVHRFTRTDATGQTVADGEYAELTLTMRAGANPGAVFDALAARGQIQLHHDAVALREALAAIAADAHRDRQRVAVVVDTREQAGELNAAVRDRSVATGRVDDTRAAMTGAGQRIGVGDRIATRRNDRTLGVANRDTWTVTAVDAQGNLTVTPTAVARGNGPPAGVTPARSRERVLPVGYVTEHVELAYATTVHGAQGDTVPAAHLVVGEHTGAAAAYVGMTRGRESNTAHLVATDLAEARQQWIAAFGRDRADLGPAHAADLAAQEAARYAQPRPLEDVLADLHAAWTGERHSLDRLASAETRRDLLRHIAALEARDADRLTALEAAGRTTAADAAHARARADASASAIATETGRRQDQLLAAWDTQRDAAHRAAHVVLAGPGWLGRRRVAVARAEAELTAWADTWRPRLPGVPDDPTQVAVFAAAADDRPRLQTALHDDARRCAESAHPKHPRLVAAARAAEATADRVQTELVHARRREEDRSLRAELSGQPGGPTAQLHDAERDVTAAARDLAAGRARIQQLHTEPALLAQPADRLSRERQRWSADHELAAAQLRAAKAPRRPPVGQWADREPVPSYAAARDRDRGVPR